MFSYEWTGWRDFGLGVHVFRGFADEVVRNEIDLQVGPWCLNFSYYTKEAE